MMADRVAILGLVFAVWGLIVLFFPNLPASSCWGKLLNLNPKDRRISSGLMFFVSLMLFVVTVGMRIENQTMISVGGWSVGLGIVLAIVHDGFYAKT